MKSLRACAVLASMALAGALVGCSSASSQQPAGSGASGASGQVTVGLIGEFSGAGGSSFGGLPKVMNAWASTVNAAGGLGGHNVRVVADDTEVGTQPGLKYATDLITQDHAVAIIDDDGSPDDATWLPYAAKAGVPVIFSSGLSMSSLGYSDTDLFPVISESPQTVFSFAKQARTEGSKFGEIYCAELSSCAATAKLVQALGAGIGLKMPVNESASSSAPDYTAVCQALKSKGVSSYNLSFAAAAVQRITDTCYQQGVKVPQLMTAGTAAAYWNTDAAFRGDIVLDKTAAYFATSTPAEKAYRGALKKYAPSIPGTDLDNASDIWTWSAGQLIAAAATHATGTLTAKSLTAGLYALHGETLGGLVQPLTYTKGKPMWPDCSYIWTINSKGKSVQPDAKPQCIPAAQIASLTAQFEGAGS